MQTPGLRIRSVCRRPALDASVPSHDEASLHTVHTRLKGTKALNCNTVSIMSPLILGYIAVSGYFKAGTTAFVIARHGRFDWTKLQA